MVEWKKKQQKKTHKCKKIRTKHAKVDGIDEKERIMDEYQYK